MQSTEINKTRDDHMSKRKAGKQGRKFIPATAVTVAPSPWDMGASGHANQDRMTIEARAHVEVETGEAINPNGVKGRRRKSWVEEYYTKGKLSGEGLAAAYRLFAAYQGHPAKDPIAAIDDVRVGGCSEPMATLIDSRREYYTMRASIPSDCLPIIAHVVLDDNPLRSMQGRNGGNDAQRFAMLDRGLCAMC
jgi:hypothetical protein